MSFSHEPAAWEHVQEWGDLILIGIFCCATSGPTFEALNPVLQDDPPLAKHPLEKLAATQVESLLAGLR